MTNLGLGGASLLAKLGPAGARRSHDFVDSASDREISGIATKSAADSGVNDYGGPTRGGFSKFRGGRMVFHAVLRVATTCMGAWGHGAMEAWGLDRPVAAYHKMG
jgi:hypothetical protein